jgi:hypothetical protein
MRSTCFRMLLITYFLIGDVSSPEVSVEDTF